MNQRASHFQLGSTSQNYASVYGKDYLPKAAEQNKIQVSNPFRSSSLKQQERGSFATTNKTLLRAWDHPEIAKLDDQKLRQLRTHHFKLGSYTPNEAMTTNKIYHDKKMLSGEASKYQEESKNKMRGHNHNFKEQNYTNYKSAYANQFTPKEAQTVVPLNTSAGQQAICFGSHSLPMVTTNGVSYTPKEAVRVKAKPEPSSGVKFGDKSEPMETINQLYYTQKEMSKACLPESTMNELRNTHFNLGQAQLQYQTESQNYRSMPGRSQQSKLTYKIPTYQSGTWANKDAKFNGATTNQRELPSRDVKPFQRAVPAMRNGIQFGGHSGQYTSEFKGKYGAPSSIVPNSIEINKKSNVVIGSSNIHHYTTQNKASYKPKDINQGRCNIDIKKLSTEDHFHIGGTTLQPKITVYQDEHRPEIDKRNRTFHKENK